MTNAFEYGDALLPPPDDKEGGEAAVSTPMDSNQPYLNLATYATVFNLSLETF